MILNLVKLNKEMNAIKIEKQDVLNNIAVIQKEMESIKEINKNLLTEKAVFESTIKELQAKVDNIKIDAVATIVAVEESVNKKVVQNLASIGVQEGLVKDEVATTVTDNTPEALYKKYESLNGKDKVKFYMDNSKAILKAMNSFHETKLPITSNLQTL
jgi:predicted transcriptional regulator